MDQLTKQYPCRILKGNRITIPKPIVKHLKLKEGDFVLRKFENGVLTFTPAIIMERD